MRLPSGPSHQNRNDVNPVAVSRYIAEDTPLSSGYKDQLFLFGLGDHGGGPTRQMLDAAMRWKNSPRAAFPNFEFTTAKQFFEDVHKRLTTSDLKIPTWNDELYLET